MLRVIELFAGIGSQAKALERLGIEHEVVAISEIDTYASKSYEAVHGEVNNMGDITKIDKLPVADLWTYSFPCTDISVAGRQEGFEKDSGTRSGLLWEVERLLKISKQHNELPTYLLLENVKNLVGKKFKVQFDEWISILDDFGYNTYWKVLNAKNYGIPQNRERVFGISILKDIDDGIFTFPEPFDNGLRLKDFLETNVDEKYYIGKDKTEKLIESLKNRNIITGQYNQKVGFKENDTACTIDASVYKGLGCNQDRNAVLINRGNLQIKEDEICSCLDANYYKGLDNHAARMPVLAAMKVGNVNPSGNGMNGSVYSEDGLAPTITTNKGEGSKILTNEISQVGMLDIKGNEQVRRVDSPDGLSPTLNTMSGGNRQPKILESISPNEVIKEFDIPSEIINDNERQRRVYNSSGVCPTVLGRTDSPKILEDFYANREVREYEDCPTIRADRQGLKVLENDLKFVGGIQTGEMWIDDGKELSRNYRSGNRVYDADGIAVSQTADGGGLAGCTGLYKVTEGIQYSRKGQPKLVDTCNTLTAQDPSRTLGNYNPIVGVLEDSCKVNGCSLRTRNYINQPQQLEVRDDELSNSVTTVGKDAMAFEETNKIQLNNPSYSQQRIYGIEGISPTICAGNLGGGKETVKHLTLGYRIRKLTPRECWRLMGFTDEDFEKAKYFTKQESEEILKKFPKHKGKRILNHEERIERMSDSQLYKMAGNSIVVNILEYIFKNLFKL